MNNDIYLVNKEFENGKKLLKTGFRNDQPIALVENTLTDFEKYIVAFYYEVENNNLTWGYGYYYDDLDSANKAFEKVINGGNLAHEYETNIEEQEKILQEEIFNFVDKVYKESQQQRIDNDRGFSLEKGKCNEFNKSYTIRGRIGNLIYTIDGNSKREVIREFNKIKEDYNKKLETKKRKDRGAR